MDNSCFPTQEAAAMLASRAAFTEFVGIRRLVGHIEPEVFFENWIKLHIFDSCEEFEDQVFGNCMKLLNEQS